MAAASDAVRVVLCGSRRDAEVLAVLPGAVYLGLGHEGGPGREGAEVVAVLAQDAVRVPVGVVISQVSAERPFAGVGVASTASVGEGRVSVGGRSWTVTRWWQPPAPRLGLGRAGRIDPDAVARLARLVPAAGSALAEREVTLAEALERSSADRHASTARHPAPGVLVLLDEAVERLVGLGDGLTPEGDDVLAGVLVALAAADGVEPPGPVRACLSDAVLARLAATTVVSQALLRAAVAGHAIAQVSDFVSACAAGDGACEADVVQRLVDVGHRSGAALARGVLMGMQSAFSARKEAA